MKSIFTDKNIEPTTNDLKLGLGETFDIWKNLIDFTVQCYPNAQSEWKYSGEKFGWSFRINDNKRVLLYLLPRDKFFKAAFVFGQKATDKVLESNVSDEIKNELKAAKSYAEGRGIRIDLKDTSNIASIHELIKIKIAN